jgi:hypothetical protein
VINRALVVALVGLWSLTCVVLGAAAFPQAHAASTETPRSDDNKPAIAFYCVDGKAVGMALTAPAAGSWSVKFDHEPCASAPAPRRAPRMS